MAVEYLGLVVDLAGGLGRGGGARSAAWIARGGESLTRQSLVRVQMVVDNVG